MNSDLQKVVDNRSSTAKLDARSIWAGVFLVIFPFSILATILDDSFLWFLSPESHWFMRILACLAISLFFSIAACFINSKPIVFRTVGSAYFVFRIFVWMFVAVEKQQDAGNSISIAFGILAFSLGARELLKAFTIKAEP